MISHREAYGLAPIARFDELAQAQEYALVVLAMNLDCLIAVEDQFESGPKYLLHADPAFALAIQEEFRLYEAEQTEVKTPPHFPIFSSGLELALIWVCSLLYFFMRQERDESFTDRYLNSSIDVVEHQEFYRPLTALFLHGDLEHLVSNVAFGLVFCILVAHSLGPWMGWGLILAAGFIGNTINVIWEYPAPFLSLGASTATFGALGILMGVGLHVAWLKRAPRESFRFLIPFVAGLILFSTMGLGGEGATNTDIGGHLFGLLAGLIIGIPASILRQGQARSAVSHAH